MLKLTVSPGDFIMIGEDIKIIFAGGERKNIPIAIDAPKDKAIIRNTARHVKGFENVDLKSKPYVDKPLSAEAKRQISAVIAEDRWKNSMSSDRHRES